MAHMTISELETKITLRNTLFALMHQSKRDTAQESAMLGKLGEASITAVDEKIRGEWLRDVNAGLKESAFIKIRSSSDNKVQRMIEAIKTLTYQKKTVREDKNSHELSLNTSDITINPVELDKFCGGIGAGDWQTIMYKLYLQISARALAEIGNTDLAQKYAEQVRLPANFFRGDNETLAVSTSKSQITKTLRDLLAAAIGDHKAAGFLRGVDARDIAFLDACISAHGRDVKSVRVLANQRFAQYVLEMFSAACEGQQYKQEFRARKEGANLVKMSFED